MTPSAGVRQSSGNQFWLVHAAFGDPVAQGPVNWLVLRNRNGKYTVAGSPRYVVVYQLAGARSDAQPLSESVTDRPWLVVVPAAPALEAEPLRSEGADNRALPAEPAWQPQTNSVRTTAGIESRLTSSRRYLREFGSAASIGTRDCLAGLA
jgi:hypothetical protein